MGDEKPGRHGDAFRVSKATNVEKNRRPHLAPSRARAGRADGDGEREGESVLTPSTPHQLFQPVSAVHFSHLVLGCFS